MGYKNTIFSWLYTYIVLQTLPTSYFSSTNSHNSSWNMTILIHKVKMQMTAGGRTRGQRMGICFNVKVAYLTFSTEKNTKSNITRKAAGEEKNCAKKIICIVALLSCFSIECPVFSHNFLSTYRHYNVLSRCSRVNSKLTISTWKGGKYRRMSVIIWVGVDFVSSFT